MYLKSFYTALCFYLVGEAGCLLSEATLPSRPLDHANRVAGPDFVIPAILPPVKSDGPCSLTKPLAYTWASGTQNGTTQSSPPSINSKKNQATDTGDTKTESSKTEESPECDGDEEEFYCEDCGGGEWDAAADVLRCKGITENNYQWKDCICIEKGREFIHYGQDSPNSDTVAEILGNLPDFTEDSYAINPPGWADKQSELERQWKTVSTSM